MGSQPARVETEREHQLVLIQVTEVLFRIVDCYESRMDLKIRVREILQDAHLMSLGVYDGAPWVADVIFIYDDNLKPCIGCLTLTVGILKLF